MHGGLRWNKIYTKLTVITVSVVRATVRLRPHIETKTWQQLSLTVHRPVHWIRVVRLFQSESRWKQPTVCYVCFTSCMYLLYLLDMQHTLWNTYPLFKRKERDIKQGCITRFEFASVLPEGLPVKTGVKSLEAMILNSFSTYQCILLCACMHEHLNTCKKFCYLLEVENVDYSTNPSSLCLFLLYKKIKEQRVDFFCGPVCTLECKNWSPSPFISWLVQQVLEAGLQVRNKQQKLIIC